MTNLSLVSRTAKGIAVASVALLLLASCGASETTITSVENAPSENASSSDSPASTETTASDPVDDAVEAAVEAVEAREAAESDSADSTDTTTDVAPDTVDVAPDEAVDDVPDAVESSGADEPRNGADFTDAEIECLEAVGYDPADLIEAGIAASSGQIGDQEEDVYNEVFRCAPDWALSDSFVSEFTSGLSEGVPGDVSEGEGRCVVQRLIDSGNGGSVLFGSEPFLTLEVFEECLTPENAAEMLGGPGTGPQTYGDDPTFDLLQDRCLGTDELNDLACDVLYFNSAAESDYEAISLTCGDREPFSDISCSPDMVDENGDLFIDPTSPGVPAVEDACRSGQMIACDYLYSLTEFGSSTEQLGATCGDRRAFDGLNLCVESFGEIAN